MQLSQGCPFAPLRVHPGLFSASPSGGKDNRIPMGHPDFGRDDAGSSLDVTRLAASRAAPHEQGGLEFEVSHPFARKKRMDGARGFLGGATRVYRWP
jgi:hypothetical protein